MTQLINRSPSANVRKLITAVTLLFFLPFLMYAVYQTVVLVGRAVGTPANITVDASHTLGTIDTSFYHAFSQGGEEQTDMLGPVVSQIRGLQPKVIRIDHIYDYYNVVSGSPGSLSFNFSRLDQTVRSIRATGATPLLSLSYMPAVISSDGTPIGSPVSWDDWALVVQRTIEHYSGRSGMNLAGVYYEVWNEPDLPQFGGWQITGAKNYLTLYRYAATGANRAANTNTFYIGGPATGGLYRNWILALVQSGARVDFLSWHTYLEDPTRLRKDQEDLTSWLIPYPIFMVKRRMITELGFTGGKDSRYSTPYAAAYTAAVVRELIDAHPAYVFSFQLKNGPGQSQTGWGLIDHESAGARKYPRYYVYNFLDTIAGTRLLLKGEGSWVTAVASTKDSKIRVLLINFDRQGYHLENVPVTVTNLTPGTYELSKTYLFQTGCAINSPKEGQPAIKVPVADSRLSTTVCMPAQNVAILELSRVGFPK